MSASRVIAALDVSYRADEAAVACVLFAGWADAAEASSFVVRVDDVQPYEPGAFFRRELPCLLAALAKVTVPLEVVAIDGYVWLSADGREGLGAHLFEALGKATPVVGIAKTSFMGSAFAEHVVRGGSARPLYVTSAGIEASAAAKLVVSMHGEHRIPTLLRRADRLCRDALP